MSSRSILVTGAGGQLGRALAGAPLPEGWRVSAWDRAALDLEDVGAVDAAIAGGCDGVPWAAVINAAAYTAVDAAETDVVKAWRINATGPAALAVACARAAIPLVHVSTDYVFSGTQHAAWQVGDPVAPLGVYGASKLGGEQAVRTAGGRTAIVRTAWVMSAHGRNFLTTMLRLATERDVVRVVADQRGSPTSASDLAAALLVIARRLASDRDAPTGTFHFANSGATDWAAVATEIFAQAARRGGPSATVEPIATVDYPTPARRPANSVLDCSAIAAEYGIQPRPWQAAVGDILAEVFGDVR